MPRTPKAYPDVVLPDGRVVTPRARLAQELGIHERTLKRANAETVYIGARAYVARDSAIMDIAGNLRRRNEPAKRRASRGPVMTRHQYVKSFIGDLLAAHGVTDKPRLIEDLVTFVVGTANEFSRDLVAHTFARERAGGDDELGEVERPSAEDTSKRRRAPPRMRMPPPGMPDCPDISRLLQEISAAENSQHGIVLLAGFDFSAFSERQREAVIETAHDLISELPVPE